MSTLDQEEKSRLLAEFAACLEADDTSEAEPDALPRVDLHTLLNEMSALKTEVRLEARQSKNTLDEMRRLIELLHDRNDQLTRELERAREQTASVQLQAETRLLEHLLDLRDRLQAGVDAVTAWRPAAWQSRLPGVRFAQRLGEGQALTLQRLDECLASYRVRPIDAVGQALDPHLMRAVSVESRPAMADGIVLSEIRRGFIRQDTLLRTAEVIVNKGPQRE